MLLVHYPLRQKEQQEHVACHQTSLLVCLVLSFYDNSSLIMCLINSSVCLYDLFIDSAIDFMSSDSILKFLSFPIILYRIGNFLSWIVIVVLTIERGTMNLSEARTRIPKVPVSENSKSRTEFIESVSHITEIK